MKNVQFSRETVSTVLTALALLPSFAISGVLVGLCVPAKFSDISQVPQVLAAISVGLALFVWSIFRLIKPVGYNRNWEIAEMTLVPLYSLMLALAATVWVAWLIQRSIQELEDIVTPLLH
jgi:hypothetical protein